MSMGGGGKKEPKDAKLLRQRQLIDLADLDEEENRRIKALFRARQGGRAFRAPTAARAPSDVAGSAGSASPAGGRSGGSLIPASGFGGGGYGGGGRSSTASKR
jgi:uncharacterized membrane protein YgcG